jgi:hypothetical protein
MIDIPNIFPEEYFDDGFKPSNKDFEDAIDREDDLYYFC